MHISLSTPRLEDIPAGEANAHAPRMPLVHLLIHLLLTDMMIGVREQLFFLFVMITCLQLEVYAAVDSLEEASSSNRTRTASFEPEELPLLSQLLNRQAVVRT